MLRLLCYECPGYYGSHVHMLLCLCLLFYVKVHDTTHETADCAVSLAASRLMIAVSHHTA